MGTSNFETMDNFDLYVYINQSCLDCDDFECECQLEYENLKFIIDNYRIIQDLKYHTVKIKSGYHQGFQIYVDTNHSSQLDLDNEDCKYYYDTCRSKAIREFKAEINKINKKILPYLAENSGLIKIKCVGTFSNGEAVYEQA